VLLNQSQVSSLLNLLEKVRPIFVKDQSFESLDLKDRASQTLSFLKFKQSGLKPFFERHFNFYREHWHFLLLEKESETFLLCL
jgi:hypothetical protein